MKVVAMKWTGCRSIQLMLLCVALTLVCSGCSSEALSENDGAPAKQTEPAVKPCEKGKPCEKAKPCETAEPASDCAATQEAEPCGTVQATAIEAAVATEPAEVQTVQSEPLLTTFTTEPPEVPLFEPPTAQQLKEMREEREAQQRAEMEQLRADPAWKPSHSETAVIEIETDAKDGPKPLRRSNLVQNFCLNLDGSLLVCYGGQSSEIRTYTTDGELVTAWSLQAKPEAICVHHDGTIFVGGEGQLTKLDQRGNVLATADLMALTELEPEQEEQAADVAGKEPSILEALAKALISAAPVPKPGAMVSDLQQAPRPRRNNVTGIAVTDQDLFVACSAPKGFSYAVYRMDHNFENAELIVDRLSGCCGQMDIQACNGELWVAHNGRHRVERYDRDGNKLASFGKSDRKAADGFGGCCEPKNVRFGPDGDIYCAESGPPNTVKRFSPDGEFRGIVVLDSFDGGCVRTTVEVSHDGREVFVLDTTNNSIHRYSAEGAAATHEQLTTISVPQGDQRATLHTFCMTGENLLVASGGERIRYTRSTTGGSEIKIDSEPAAIRVINTDGELTATWPLEMTPQAINVAPDGTIFVAGQGRLAKLDQDGNVILSADSPQVAELEPLPPLPEEEEEEEEEKQPEIDREAAQKEIQEAMQAYLKANQEYVALRRGDDKEAIKEAQETANEAMTAYQELSQKYQQFTISPRDLAIQKRYMALRKRAVTGMAATERDVFVACAATKGSGFDVWRTDHDFGSPEKIVTGLRGCCGQMDIQACNGELWVAENGRAQVVRYDRDGKQLAVWGKKDRQGLVGFGSCCNPMNIRFGPDGVVYTSESNLGRIKRFSPEGEFLGLLGIVKIVPGCKHVPIGINKDGSRVYMLDITRSHIVVMASKEPAAAVKVTATDETLR